LKIVQSATYSASASGDSWLNGSLTTTNYGSTTTMRVDFTSTAPGNGRAVVKFDLSSIPSGATVTGVTLHLTVTGASSKGSTRSVGVYSLTRDWVESQVTWTRAQTGTNWTTLGGDYTATALATTSVTGLAQYSWTSASLITAVQGWVTTPANNYGLLLGNGSTTSTGRKDFGTS
jgi:hypothetical protein